DCSRGIAVSRVLLVIACYFSCGPLATKTEAGSPGHDLRLKKEAKSLETRWEVDWAATASCAADKQGAMDGDGSRCFPLVITMRVVADRACHYTPRVSAKTPGGRAQQRKRMGVRHSGSQPRE